MNNPESQSQQANKHMKSKIESKLDKKSKDNSKMVDLSHASTNQESDPTNLARSQRTTNQIVDPTIQSCVLNQNKTESSDAGSRYLSDNINKILKAPDENCRARQNDHKTFMPDPSKVKQMMKDIGIASTSTKSSKVQGVQNKFLAQQLLQLGQMNLLKSTQLAATHTNLNKMSNADISKAYLNNMSLLQANSAQNMLLQQMIIQAQVNQQKQELTNQMVLQQFRATAQKNSSKLGHLINGQNQIQPQLKLGDILYSAEKNYYTPNNQDNDTFKTVQKQQTLTAKKSESMTPKLTGLIPRFNLPLQLTNMANRGGLQSQRQSDSAANISNMSMDGGSVEKEERCDAQMISDDEQRDARKKAESCYSMSESRSSSCGSFHGSSLSLEERKQKVIRYWEKKKARMSKNHVRYHCRKDLAENRFRYHGRFISKDQMEKILNNEGGLDEIYNPKIKCTPKTKQIFKVDKWQRSTSCCSDKCQSRTRNNPSTEVINGLSNSGSEYGSAFPIENNLNHFGMNDDFSHNMRLFGAQTKNMSMGIARQDDECFKVPTSNISMNIEQTNLMKEAMPIKAETQIEDEHNLHKFNQHFGWN